jgi:hypothetical protein
MNRSVELVAALLPVCGLAFLWSERLGLWDQWLGLDLVEDVATRFESSYAEGVDRQVEGNEKAWEPLLDLIERYSSAELPTGREPKMLARMQAVQSNKIQTPAGIAEWTAPTTPVLLVYKGRGAKLTNEDVCLVGTIGDLRVWAARRRDDFRFFAHDVSITLASVGLAFLIWFRGSPRQRDRATDKDAAPDAPEHEEGS